MRRQISIALASLFVAALVAPIAQAATRRYRLPGVPRIRGREISVVLLYKNKQRHGSYTPRQASYDATVSALSCNPPVAQPYANTGSYIRGTPDYNLIKLRKESFTYSDTYSDDTSAISATATGRVIKKKPGVREQARVDGSVSILDYTFLDYNLLYHGPYNCTSGGPVPYSATPCRWPDRPSYIKKSLPLCLPP